MGITPAYAGKSRTLHMEQDAVRDHPRLCGEKTTTQTRFERKLGSPPPMRGKGFNSIFIYTSSGITPAYAGKSGR